MTKKQPQPTKKVVKQGWIDHSTVRVIVIPTKQQFSSMIVHSDSTR